MGMDIRLEEDIVLQVIAVANKDIVILIVRNNFRKLNKNSVSLPQYRKQLETIELNTALGNNREFLLNTLNFLRAITIIISSFNDSVDLHRG